jgi:hypothetical protein
MNDESTNFGGSAVSATNAPSLPAAVDRATFQAELDRLRVGRRRTPGKATRSPRPDGAYPWSALICSSRNPTPSKSSPPVAVMDASCA